MRRRTAEAAEKSFITMGNTQARIAVGLILLTGWPLCRAQEAPASASRTEPERGEMIGPQAEEGALALLEPAPAPAPEPGDGDIFTEFMNRPAPLVVDDDFDTPVTSIISENDLFGGTDRNYTNGLRLERFSSASEANIWLRRAASLIPLIDIEQTEIRQGVGLAHAIFTPADIREVPPDPRDRPYAGWLNVSLSAVATDVSHAQQHAVQLNVGVVGPSALGRFVQDEWHALIQERQPLGWDYQLDDELGIEIIGERLRRLGLYSFGSFEVDSAVYSEVSLGNVHTHVGVGAIGRIGFDLDSDFGPPRIRPSLGGAGVFDPTEDFGGYLFFGLEGRAVAHNIFLDGSLFRDDSPHVEDRRLFVGDFEGGLAVHVKRVQVAFTYVHRTEQFKYQAGPDRFGAVSLSVAY